MSRGLGSMQRDILTAYDALVPTNLALPGQYVDRTGQAYESAAICTPGLLREQVAKLRGAWCTHDCHTPIDPTWPPDLQRAFARRGVHTPHISHKASCRGFHAAFSRALTSLLQRGTLVRVHYPAYFELGIQNGVRLVARPKC